MMKTNVIWIDPNVTNIQNRDYTEEFEKLKYIKLKTFHQVDEAIIYLKSIKFEETIVILSGWPYSEFVSSFKKNINQIYVIPKIVVFTLNRNKFLQYNKDYENENNAFYKFGGIETSYPKIYEFIKNNNKDAQNKNKMFKEKINILDEVQFLVEDINCKEKLMLPLCFKALIKNISEDEIKEYINSLYDKYSKESNELKNILDILKLIPKIPMEILSKYLIRLYTLDSSFHRNINKDLELNKIEEHLPFIKILYEGIKLKSLSLSSDIPLFHVSKLSIATLNKIKYFMKIQKKDLPNAIVYNKSFLSFTKNKNIAEGILNKIKDQNMTKVLYILESDENIDHNLSTHADIEKISFFPNEKEVLFFPFSSFEIKEINEVIISNEIIYEIKLLHLGKYLDEIKNDEQIIKSEIELPESDYKKLLFESGLINKKIIDKINIKSLFTEYKKYENKLDSNNFILGEVHIDSKNKYDQIQIINYNDYFYDNKKEIEENCQIFIEGEKINFSFKYKFPKEGVYKIKYIFKKYITNASYMFSRCKFLTNLDLSNFNTKKITNMDYMFENCKSLTKLYLSNFNTKKVTTMKGMFSFCESLKNLDLAFFNTRNVTSMYRMFDGCKLLKNLDVSSFNTQNVINMDYMFADCSSLANLNLLNFNVQNTVYMRNMFYNCISLINLKTNFNNMMNNNNMNNNLMNGNILLNNNMNNGMYNQNKGDIPNINNLQNNENMYIENNNEIILNFLFYNSLSYLVRCKLAEKLIDVIERFKKTQCPTILKNSLDFPLLNGHQLDINQMIFELEVNNNDIIFFIDTIKNNEEGKRNEFQENKINNDDNNNAVGVEEDIIIINEHAHKLAYLISIFDWSCSLCKKNYTKSKGKYYCSLCDFNLCENCHMERNLPKRKAFQEEIEPPYLDIKSPFTQSQYHEHKLIYCRSSRYTSKFNNWRCDNCGLSFDNEIWSFYCTNCDFDLCCKCAGF